MNVWDSCAKILLKIGFFGWKGQCHEIFYQKTSPAPHFNNRTRFHDYFYSFGKIFARNACLRTLQWLTSLTHRKLFYVRKKTNDISNPLNTHNTYINSQTTYTQYTQPVLRIRNDYSGSSFEISEFRIHAHCPIVHMQ